MIITLKNRYNFSRAFSGNQLKCFLSGLFTIFIISTQAQNVQLVLRPGSFNIANISSWANGPGNSFYAMENTGFRTLKIARIDLDSGAAGTALRVGKILDLSSMISEVKTKYNWQTDIDGKILCSSEDGKWLGIVMSSNSVYKVILLDFKNESIRYCLPLKDGGDFDAIFSIFQDDRLVINKIHWMSKLFRKGFDKKEFGYEYDLLRDSFRNLAYVDSARILFSPRLKRYPVEKFKSSKEISHLHLSGKFDGSDLIFKKGSREIFREKALLNDSLVVDNRNDFSLIYMSGKRADTTFLIIEHGSGNFLVQKKSINPDLLLINKQKVWLLTRKNEMTVIEFYSRQDSGKTREIYSGSNYQDASLYWKKFMPEVFPLHSHRTIRDHKDVEVLGKFRSDRALFLRKGNKVFSFNLADRIFERKLNPDVLKNEMIFPARNSPEFVFSMDSIKILGFGKNHSGLFINGSAVIIGIAKPEVGKSISDAFISDVSKDGNLLCYSHDLIGIEATNKKLSNLWTNVDRYPSLSLKLLEDQRVLARLRSDFCFEFLNVSSGEKFLSAYVDTSSLDWIMWTPSGYYDCSPAGEKLIGWSVGRGPDSLPGLYPASRFRSQFYRPDVIDSALSFCSEDMALSKLRQPKGLKAQNQIRDNLPPIIRIESPGINEFFNDTLVEIKYRMHQGSRPVHSIRFFIDGRPVRNFTPERGSQSITVSLPARNCSIGLSAVSEKGESDIAIVSLIWRGEKPLAESFRKPNLYILAVGVSAYQDKGLSLKLPSKDAADFIRFFEHQQGGLYESIQTKLLLDSGANRISIQAGLEWLEKNVTSRDVCMIFLAGHGENDNNNNFYFLPWEADPNRMKSTCVPYFDFKSTIQALPGKVLFFADACRSGNVFGDLTRRSANLDFLARELASGNGGAIVFTSSGRNQASLEDPSWGNGAFSKAVLEGLSGQADVFNEGFITVKSLDLFLNRRVKEITDGRQTPQTIIPESISDFAIAVKKE